MKTYDLTKPEPETPDSITRELERYKVIADYYKEYDDKNETPLRTKPNQSYLLMITERLFTDIPKEKIPEGLEVLYLDLRKFFAEKFQYLKC